MMSIIYMNIHTCVYVSQLDHCKEEGYLQLEDLSIFVSSHDSKVKAPAENISKAFLEVIIYSTKHSYKRRCSMDEVSLWLH